MTEKYNIKALRDALIKAEVLLRVCEWPEGIDKEGVEQVMSEIGKALSMPPRNCDVYTESEVLDEFERQIGEAPSPTAEVQDRHMREIWWLFYKWLYMTEDEVGGTK